MEDAATGSVIDLTDGAESSALARARELMAMSADAGWIAGTLNREGYHPRRNQPWSPEDVLRLMGKTKRSKGPLTPTSPRR